MSAGIAERFAALPVKTVDSVGRALRAALAGSGEGAVAEARLILGHVLGLDLTGLIAKGDRLVSDDEIDRIATLAERRIAGEPVQRVIGEAWFRGLRFALSEATLVPRPDTETLVETALSRLEGVAAPVFADLGVGSGAIVVALLAERADARAVASDLAEEALRTARANAAANGVDDRVIFVAGSQGSMLAPGAFDAILSNPPYIETAEIDALDAEVRLHDPRLALDGGADGLDAYREIGTQAIVALKPGGILAVEIGWRQGEAVAALFAAVGLEGVSVVPDLAGRDRVVVATRPRDRAASK